MADGSFTFLRFRPANLPSGVIPPATTSDAFECGGVRNASDGPLTPHSSARHARGGMHRARLNGFLAMLEASKRYAVLGPCPGVGKATRTHALMNARELSRFKGELIYWCAHCRAAHRASWPHLQLSFAEAAVAAEHENAQIEAARA